ncbi:MAG TPA: FtsX-like permease family protein [Dinghuibacter sp.]|uniref:FtsX-like permease family protein n=1 Tax=Dinghuibacter sp. TaxID=2024697 RepID=UPI002C0F7CCD|nr:FtsX-like permease family protein [Dinghuibacter sp.]HTJ10836.1 FtsX-like permease family protein [Dinghuibacter sp.]
MYRNYLLVALRQFRRQKMYAAIKIGGFALSITACVLIALYIRDEMAIDSHIPDADRAFRFVSDWHKVGQGIFSSDPAPLGPALTENFPQIEKAGRVMGNALFDKAGANQVRTAQQTQNTYEEKFVFADQAFMDVMGFPMLYGQPGHALDAPYTVVIRKRIADKYFPGQNPVGQVVILNDDKTHPYTVTGVIPDYTSVSSVTEDWFLTLKGVELWPGEQGDWGAYNYSTFYKLKPGVDPVAFGKLMSATLARRYYVPNMKANGDNDAEKKGALLSVYMQPLRDVYLHSSGIDGGWDKGDIKLIWMFGGIACFILLIACINFINLATAKSANRAKEVGLRKVVGSQRGSLIRQFLTESMLYSFLSVALGVVLAYVLIPFFNQLTGKELSMPWSEWWLAPSLLAVIFVVGVVAGLYPAFYLSNFQPAKVLKGNVARGSRNSALRSTLVVFQFTTSIILIIGAFVVYRQMQFILRQKIGFDKDQVMILQGTTAVKDIQAFKNDLLRIPQVKSVSVSDYLPVYVPGDKMDANGFYKWGHAKTDPEQFCQYWIVDHDYLPTMGMTMLDGRNFSKEMAGDTAAVVVNEEFAKRLGLGPHPVGSLIDHSGAQLRVVGVIKNFTSFFKYDMPAVCLKLGVSPGLVSIKLGTPNIGNVIPVVSQVWKQHVPNQNLRYLFMDEGFRTFYKDVQRDGSILTCFTVLAVIIACLGLFALSSFMAEQRIKEIGIRKVLGASIPHLLALMSRNFVFLILLSVLIASPVAWWAMNRWLQDFKADYRQPVDLWVFGAVGLAALLIALCTTGYQSLRAALENPIKSLKSE